MKNALVCAISTVFCSTTGSWPCHSNRSESARLLVCMSGNYLNAWVVTKSMSVAYEFFDREKHPRSSRCESTPIGKFENFGKTSRNIGNLLSENSKTQQTSIQWDGASIKLGSQGRAAFQFMHCRIPHCNHRDVSKNRYSVKKPESAQDWKPE